jgi:hypothetical protein
MFRPSIRTARRSACVAVVVAVTAVAAVFVPVASAASCSSQTLSTPFSLLGDWNKYYLTPGGSFESSAWSGGSLVNGSDPFKLNSVFDSHAMQINGQATSPSFCITRDDPSLRFVARSTRIPGSNGNYSQLNVSVSVRNSSGSAANFFLGVLQPQGNGWFVSPRMEYGSLFDSWLFGTDGTGTAQMQIVLTVAGQGGSWTVDDVYVDPFAGK